MNQSNGPTRRRVLLGIGAGTVALAGCTASVSDGAENPPTLGDPDADVVLEVYEDLGCPACAQFNTERNGFPAIESEYIEPGLIRYEHRDMITTGLGAEEAANAAREVFERHGNEAFWAFKSAILTQHDRVGSEVLALVGEVATEQDLDADAIEAAAANGTHQDVVDADVSRAESIGANRTPSFVVDESLVGAGAGAVQEVVRELDEALQ